MTYLDEVQRIEREEEENVSWEADVRKEKTRTRRYLRKQSVSAEMTVPADIAERSGCRQRSVKALCLRRREMTVASERKRAAESRSISLERTADFILRTAIISAHRENCQMGSGWPDRADQAELPGRKAGKRVFDGGKHGGLSGARTRGDISSCRHPVYRAMRRRRLRYQPGRRWMARSIIS